MRVALAKFDELLFFGSGERRAFFDFVMRQLDFGHRVFEVVVLHREREYGAEKLLYFLSRSVFPLLYDAEQILLNFLAGDLVDMLVAEVGNKLCFDQTFVAFVSAVFERRFLLGKPFT